ncbi:MAG: hypothetical protein M3537_03210, partial [Chloroflexota bacterium]|nr:hypothetical protein [Chloroflexota bacterium]
VWARAAAGMSGSNLGAGVGEAVVVGLAVVEGDEVAVLEADAAGLASPPHPASSMDAASGTASSAVEYLFTVPPTVMTS